MSVISGLAVWGNNVTDVLNTWADMGVFAYVLPFLLIFAVVFGILNKTRILGGNRGVMTVIALAVGLMALQFDYVTNFFATIFPYAGMGIGILLVFLILTGLFVETGQKAYWIVYFVIACLITLVVVLGSLANYDWWGAWWWEEWWPTIIIGLIVIGGVGAIIATSGKNSLGSSSGSSGTTT